MSCCKTKHPPHHTTPHHTTPHHTTPHHTTPHHTTPGGCAKQELHCPQPPGSEAVYHCSLPSAHNYSAAGHTQCSAVHSTKKCGTTQKALKVQHGSQGAVGR